MTFIDCPFDPIIFNNNLTREEKRGKEQGGMFPRPKKGQKGTSGTCRNVYVDGVSFYRAISLKHKCASMCLALYDAAETPWVWWTDLRPETGFSLSKTRRGGNLIYNFDLIHIRNLFAKLIKGVSFEC